MNRATIIGRLVRDPDVRQTADEKAVARFTLAVDRLGNTEPKTDFINIVSFGKLAEFAQKYLNKGIKIGVDGKIITGSYTNKDGNKVNTVEIMANSIDFADGKPEKKAEAKAEPMNDGFMSVDDAMLPWN